MPAPQPVRIFVSYSHANDAAVQRLQRDLEQAGAVIWIDHESLVPGMPDWEDAVRDGIAQASFVVYAASPDARKSPYVRDEINLARSRGRDVIPFWVAGDDWLDCAPLGWGTSQYSDGRAHSYAAGLQKLLRRLGLAAPSAATTQAPTPQPSAPQQQRPAPQPAAPTAPRPSLLSMPPERFPERLLALGFTPQARDRVEWIVPPVCLVPAGEYRMGSDKTHDPQAFGDESDRYTVDLPAFEIARFPVTVAEYARFLHATERKEPRNWATQCKLAQDHPVVYTSWYDAADYAAWLDERTQQPWRLPTEAEWEKAARCDPRDPLSASSQRIYPWGDRFETTRCNTSESGHGATTPVGWYGPDDPDPRAGRQSGASPCGAEDMAGNVWEWLATAYVGNYRTSDTVEERSSTVIRCLHGGSWFNNAAFARAAHRYDGQPVLVGSYTGFRLVRASPGR